MPGRRDREEKLLEDIKTLLENKDREAGRTAPSLKTPFDITSTTRDAAGRLTQIVLTDGVTTKTIDIARDADGRIETTDETVS